MSRGVIDGTSGKGTLWYKIWYVSQDLLWYDTVEDSGEVL